MTDSGLLIGEMRYREASRSEQRERRDKAWGETRFSSGNTTTDYRFTGQREEAGIGLYYYRARWYDPALGRFGQADTYGGGDRYEYVHNSPVTFTDPWGHWTCYLEGVNGQCLPPGSPGQPTILDVGSLSDVKHDKTGISAKDLYLDYLSRYDDESGWWWDTLGGRDGFTLEDYLSIWGHVELMGLNGQAKTLAEAGFRYYVMWARDLGVGRTAFNFLDWFSGYSGSAGKYIREGASVSEPSEHLLDSTFGIGLIHPKPDWLSGLDPTRPYGWGNKSILSVDQSKVYERYHEAMFFVYGAGPGSDTFYIPSGCAARDWETGDLSHCWLGR